MSVRLGLKKGWICTCHIRVRCHICVCLFGTLKGSVKYLCRFCVFGGKLGGLNLTDVLCELKVMESYDKSSFGLNQYSGKLTYALEINVMS